MPQKFLDRLFTIAEQYKAGEISEQVCRDKLASVLYDLEHLDRPKRIYRQPSRADLTKRKRSG